MTGPYLKYARLDSFGAFRNKSMGPFSPQLNVVFGRNESGKTTLSQFVGGVLFGWEDARGNRNTYKPDDSERAGALIFAEQAPDGREEEFELARMRNADGVQGRTDLIANIDKETFRTMFALTSDELRSLRNTSDMTARLLTAGSGTSASPAQALADINQRIKNYTSRASSAENSIVRLSEQLRDLQAQVRLAAEETERLKAEDREYHELEIERDNISERIAELNEEIDTLVAQRALLDQIDDQHARTKQELESVLEDRANYRAISPRSFGGLAPDDLDARLLDLDSSKERSLRDTLDKFADQQAHCAHSVEVAQENQASSQAAYDALIELRDSENKTSVRKRQRFIQLVISVALPLVFVVCGIPLFMHGRQINSLSFTAVGIGLVLFALLLAVGALVLVFRPNKGDDLLEQRLQDAQWVMLQDKKKLESSLAAQEATDERVAAWLQQEGLGEADGSVRAARVLLDDAKDARGQRALARQRIASYAMRISSLEETLRDLEQQKEDILAACDLPAATQMAESSFARLDAVIARKSSQRDNLVETLQQVNLRYGELGETLARAKAMHAYSDLKQEYQQVRTRYNDSEAKLARLLIARRMLESAITAWESHSQPEVYAQASELLSLMTDGAWVRVSMTPEGKLVATDAVHNVREPRFLSLGTCQQMYLALRIALLMYADNVGRAVPILADDILVNFDAKRRLGAARALAMLAEKRQVILFTCHEEVVDAVTQVDESCMKVEL